LLKRLLEVGAPLASTWGFAAPACLQQGAAATLTCEPSGNRRAGVSWHRCLCLPNYFNNIRSHLKRLSLTRQFPSHVHPTQHPQPALLKAFLRLQDSCRCLPPVAGTRGGEAQAKLLRRAAKKCVEPPHGLKAMLWWACGVAFGSSLPPMQGWHQISCYDPLH